VNLAPAARDMVFTRPRGQSGESGADHGIESRFGEWLRDNQARDHPGPLRDRRPRFQTGQRSKSIPAARTPVRSADQCLVPTTLIDAQ
jgi:hypothetical protein